jgi:MFS family permease
VRTGRRHYAWIVFGVAFLTLLAAAGFRSTPGVLIDPLHDEFGWSRGTVGAAVSVNLVLFGLVGPFAAALMARFGLRRVVATALATVSLGALGTTQMHSPWQLIALWGVVVGIGSGCMATVFAATVATRWFVAKRGVVTGALTAAGATGQLIFLPLLSRLTSDVGWRWVGFTIALAASAAIPVVVLLLRDDPADVGELPYGAPPDYVAPARVSNPIGTAFHALRDVHRSGAFWLLFGSFFICGLSTNGLIQTHFISAANDHHIDETSAAGLLALVGVFDVIGTIGSGWLTDRVDPRRLLFAYYGLRGLSLMLLDPALEARNAGLWTFMVFYGLDWVATVPPTVALCAQQFGRERGAVVYGWVFAGHQIGAALMAWSAGALRDQTGTYRPAWIVAGVGCFIAAAGTQRIGGDRPARDALVLARAPV